MTTFLEGLKQDIDRRLEELRPQVEEIPRLEAALAALESVAGPAAPAASAGTAARASRPAGADADVRAPSARVGGAAGRARGGATGRRRAGRGQRREEFLRLVKGAPDVSVSEAARQMGVSPSQVSNLARKLQDEGTLRREPDGRWLFVGPAASAPEAPAHDRALATPEAPADEVALAASWVSGERPDEPPADAGDLATDEGVNEGTDEMVRESPAGPAGDDVAPPAAPSADPDFDDPPDEPRGEGHPDAGVPEPLRWPGG